MVTIMAELLVSSVFSRVDLSVLAEIARRSSIKIHPEGAQICRYGESSDGMFVLVRGETIAGVAGENGREIIGRGGAGTVFGELGVISGRPRSAFVEVTSEEASVIAIPCSAVDDLLARRTGYAVLLASNSRSRRSSRLLVQERCESPCIVRCARDPREN